MSVARTFVAPIHRLARGAVAVRDGRYTDARVSVSGNDEITALTNTFNEMVDGVIARERERDIFGRVVSPEVREVLLNGELSLGGESRRVSALFSDIRGFSTLSEQMSPQDVVEFLNEYLTVMAEAVKPFGGYINNFIGDAIVVVFGAPQPLPDIEWRAVQAARAMKSHLTELNRRREQLGDQPLMTGIGISTGKVVAGQVGSLERFLYTVIGDAVNVAARLEAMTKDVDGNPILINGATYEGICHRDDVSARDLGLLQVKGRSEPVHVFAIDN
jgi:class 3 adenylate cyclase